MLIDHLEERALSLRQIFVYGDINDQMAYDIIHQLNYLASVSMKDIVLAIHSDGGDVDSATAIVDEMQAAQRSGIKVCTIAIGNAHSAAAYILSLGTKGYRLGRPNCSIMLHPCSLALDSDYENNQVAAMEFLRKRTDIMQKQVAKACGKLNKYKNFKNDIDKGLWLDAEEAINYGVIDKIWDKSLPIGGNDNEQDEEGD